MFRLSLIISFSIFAISLLAQVEKSNDSPHGASLSMDCKKCHSTSGWTVDAKNIEFTHDSTDFILEGQHQSVDCKSCHQTLIFSEAKSECINCHVDMHNETVGMDCARCHDPSSWLVSNISELHEFASFPLDGVHFDVSCNECHVSATELEFFPILPECSTCHQSDYDGTTEPDHKASDYSTDCASCHSLSSFDWSADNFEHSFFPLTLGHSRVRCSECHEDNMYENLPTDCYYCHQSDYNESRSPNHITGDFSVNCLDCHTTEPEWKPATYLEHDQIYFPIYQGKHNGEWDNCNECHQTPDDYNEFSCTHCHDHSKNRMDNEHDDIDGYVYEDKACYACHPTGNSDHVFNHDNSSFPLTGAHRMAECQECHSDGYLGTPSTCLACHEADYSESQNPDHLQLNISTDCALCHTTDPNWKPASFDIHDDYYPLLGAHKIIASDCVSCHNGEYNDTPATCFACHQADYENSLDPPHSSLQFSEDCASCHTESAWVPSTFDHDMQYFPVYSGAHDGTWTNCSECHTQNNDYALFSCIDCHDHNQMKSDEEHEGVGGYSYESQACFACHPAGNADDVFDHNLTNFPLSGAHTSVACEECHEMGYEGTPTLCLDCHQTDYNETINPDHQQLNIGTDCISCHTTDPDWIPASFEIHDDYYQLNGAHLIIKNDCAACHQGNYNSTPNTCFACHEQDYEQTTDPPHATAQFSTDCRECHSENSWSPSTFDHDLQYFPVYSGKHEGEWAACTDCHTNSNNYSVFNCINCHEHNQVKSDEEHQMVSGYMYESNACFACHPTGDADEAFNHNSTAFPLTGAHTVVECAQCHINSYEGTPTDCFACHEADFTQTVNPNHSTLSLSANCVECHSTEPGWSPATFAIHNSYYTLTGAHIALTNDCAACHNGDYTNTPNNCAGCHTPDYNESSNPNHQELALSNDCASCHSTDPGWTPAGFDVHNEYYVLNGAHAIIANDCITCHNGNYTTTPNTCFACHEVEYNETNNPDHLASQFSTDCSSCHNEDSWTPSNFDHDALYFPIYSGKHDNEWNQCVECHTDNNNYEIFTCISCHTNPDTDEEHEGIGGYAYESQACFACHPTGDADDGFDHNTTNFPLNGAHLNADCIACHENGYIGTSSLCLDCHMEAYEQTENPNHIESGISNDCISCHTSEPGWAPATFDTHGDYYPLSGAHIEIANDCILCHNGDYLNTPSECAGCHTPDYNESSNPDHQLLSFSTDCTTCHTTDPGWSPASFDQHNDFYTLTGAHIPIANDCILCHNGDYTNTPNDCAACHTQDYNESSNPDHQLLSFSMDCNSCHTTDPGWSPASFDEHNNYYVFTGAHIPIANDCNLCHNGVYTNTPNECAGCHTQDYNESSNPDHQLLSFSMDCITCHTTDPGWSPASFDEHNNYYVFTGAHIPIANDCNLCHNGVYTNTPNDCAGCHTQDYNESSNPDHQLLSFSMDCNSCHTTDPGWSPATFDEHNNYYVFTGAHIPIANDCNLCHNGVYTNTPNDCAGCHTPDYEQSTNPDHQQLGLSTDCNSCHTTDPGWTPASFDQHNDYYTLTGAHIPIANDCNLCHNGDYINTPNDCAGCHIPDYNQSTNPDHQQLGLSDDCIGCHTTDPGWSPANFDVHDDYYPLTGAHSIISNECATCHSGDYVNTPSDCAGCHINDYNQTNNPDHIELEISTDCASCHTTDPGWTPATFDVHNDYYPLTGAHAAIASECIACHSNGYSNTPNTCFGCHESDYNNTSDPDHLTAQFPTDCEACHTDLSWIPSTFDHDGMYFPIYSGKHDEEWNQCSDCHNVANDYSIFDCLSCHTNPQTDEDHNEVNGYTYDSPSCFACHPDGND